MKIERKWWKEAVVYQIYPRSFCDSNGDGIGDIRGIISKLGYLRELGVDVIWLCPVYKSPNDDNGYDISDYYSIVNEFGTMVDFEELLEKAHDAGLKIIMDLVVNHTSDEHEWFLASKVSKQSDKRDYYIWRPGKDGVEPNNWASFFTPSAWAYDTCSGEYYLHLFSKEQPDLNWENKKLRQEIYSMMTWWLEKGIDGFRMDVINCISKTDGLPDVQPSFGWYEWAGKYFMNGPRVHDYLREMNENVLSKSDIMTVGETPGASTEDALLYASNDGKELNMVFQSELMDIDSGPAGKWDGCGWRLGEFKKIISKWQLQLYGKAWNSIFLGNHDQPRIVSRFGNDASFWEASAKMLATLLLTLQGTVYIYQGDEIGMTSTKFGAIHDCRDIETLNYYDAAVKKGIEQSEIMQRISQKGRDNARTPMQWSKGKNAGFTEGVPWIAVNPNYKIINVDNELNNQNSVCNFYKRLIKLRHENPLLTYGIYKPLCENSEEIMAYIREEENIRFLIVLNFTSHNTLFEKNDEVKKYELKLLIGNLEKHGNDYFHQDQIMLKPYESLVFSLNT